MLRQIRDTGKPRKFWIYGESLVKVTFADGNAEVTSVRKDLFSHLRISQQFFKLLTLGSRVLKAVSERDWSARNMI